MGYAGVPTTNTFFPLNLDGRRVVVVYARCLFLSLAQLASSILSHMGKNLTHIGLDLCPEIVYANL